MRPTRESAGPAAGVPADRHAALAARSIEIIRAGQHASGAYVAAPTFPVYGYCWLRDGAFIADAMSRVGEVESADAFFGWCRRIVEARSDKITRLVARRRAGESIDVTEFLHTRYTLDGREADEPWWNHQLDGYGAWLWALGAHADRHWRTATARRFAAAVEATAGYLIAFWDQPSYDCWEEHGDRVHVATLAAIAAGLRVAARWPEVSSEVQVAAATTAAAINRRIRDEGTREGHLVKWLGGKDLDASLLFCAIPYKLVTPRDPLMWATVTALGRTLAHGGVHRHEADVYYGGGEWVLLAALLGSYHVAVGDLAAARVQLDWVAAQADADGCLPEQASNHLLHPDRLADWRDRWGPIASPLLWSHAMHLNLYHELYARR